MTRMEAFIDGVFAIAITLLVLEIAVPAGSEDLWRAFLDEWPSYLGYLVSFSTIGAVWVGHTVITEFTARATPVFVRLNLLLLMVVSFLPFPTKLLAEYVGEDRPERVAATINGLNLFLTAVLLSVLWRYAVREGLIRSDISDQGVKVITRRLAPGLVGYLVMIAPRAGVRTSAGRGVDAADEGVGPQQEAEDRGAVVVDEELREGGLAPAPVFSASPSRNITAPTADGLRSARWL